MKENSNNRIVWVDIAKGIGIILVLIGHISQNKNLHYFIYSFHMPLFFIISGYLYSEKEQYVRKKAKSILLPYLFWSIVSFLYWVLIERNLRTQNLNPIIPATNILIARGGEDNYIFNVALWFLPCLFVTEVMFHFLKKRIKNIKILSIIILFFSILGYIYSKLNFIRLPFCLDITLIAIGFYFLGYLWKQKIEIAFKQFNNKIWKSYIIIGVMTIVTVVVSQINYGMSMNSLKFNNYFFTYIASISGCLVIYIISNIINKNRMLQFLGRNTLIIMCIHEPIKRILIEIIHRVTNISTEILRNNIFGIIFITVILLIVLLPCIYIINRYFPILIGKSKQNVNKNKEIKS